jgi:hypothetical protein
MRALMLLFVAVAASAQPISQTVQAGEVSLTVRVTPQNPVVGDELHLELEVAAPKGMRIELPDNPGFVDCAEVLDHDSSSPAAAPDRTIYHENFLLDPTGPGTCHIPALGVRYDAGVLASQPIVFPIASLIPPEERKPDIHDGQTPLVLPEQHVNWTFIALATLVLAAVLVWFTFSGRRPKERRLEVESAEVRARRRLARLALSPSPVPREFYSELSRILSGYLDERLGLRSTRCTSSEMLAAVQRTGLITPAGRELLEALLEDCDYAKFSAHCTLGDNPQEAVECCRQIIDILGKQTAARPRELTRA